MSKKAVKGAPKTNRKHSTKKLPGYIVKGIVDSQAPVLRLNNVVKKFGSFTAVKGVSFEMKRGERIGVLGANGAGKTTLTEIIAGLIVPTSGYIEFGFDFKNTPKEKMGMQFQQSSYPSGLTVKDIIAFAKNIRKLKLPKRELNELLTIFQMQEMMNKRASALSGGQRQKLNILLAILHKPELVILDELSTGLDISAREDIMEFTDRLLTMRNISALVISHHMAEIKALCSKIVVLDHGYVKRIATIAEIEQEYGTLDKFMTLLIKQGIVEERRSQTMQAQAKGRGR